MEPIFEERLRRISLSWKYIWNVTLSEKKKFLIFSWLMNKRLRIIIRIFSGSKLNIRNSRMSRRTLQHTRRQPSRIKRLTPWPAKSAPATKRHVERTISSTKEEVSPCPLFYTNDTI